MKLTIFGAILIGYTNTPYRWGGQNYLAVDCSGFVLMALNDYGITLPDMTSQGIYDWSLRQDDFYNCEPTKPDCLLFFGSSTTKITHIEVSLGGGYMIGASGAGRDSINMSIEELARRDARVKIKKLTARRDLVASIKIGEMK